MNAATVRVDKWLWAARFYKTRALAATAVNGGRVQVNGSRVKPANILKPGDRLRINKAGCVFDIEVCELSERRGSAALAQALYKEEQDSIDRREQEQAQRRLASAATPHPARRPDKRARRKLRETRLKNMGD